MSKLDGIKPGDRVRVTFEGEVGDNPRPDIPDVYPLTVKADGREVENVFHANTVKAPTFHIEKLAPPLKVGDRVVYMGYNSLGVGELQGIWDHVAWVSFKSEMPSNVPLSELRAAQ